MLRKLGSSISKIVPLARHTKTNRQHFSNVSRVPFTEMQYDNKERFPIRDSVLLPKEHLYPGYQSLFDSINDLINNALLSALISPSISIAWLSLTHQMLLESPVATSALITGVDCMLQKI